MSGTDGRFELLPTAPGSWQVAAVRAEGFAPFGPEWGRSPLSLTASPGLRVNEVVTRRRVGGG